MLNLLFCSEGPFLMLPVIPLLCFFFTSVVTFVKLKEKFKLTNFKSLKETSKIHLKEVKI